MRSNLEVGNCLIEDVLEGDPACKSTAVPRALEVHVAAETRKFGLRRVSYLQK